MTVSTNVAFPSMRERSPPPEPGVVRSAKRLYANLVPADEAEVAPAKARPILTSWGSHLCLLALAAALIVVGPHHRSWFDEAQAWLIARDDDPWTILSRTVRREGSPGLWHLLLWSLQKLGLPYSGLWTVSAALAVLGAAATLYLAPFPLWLRAGVVFSYFGAYQFAIVSRSYALDLLLFPLLAAAWNHRRRRPLLYALLLGLAANANAHTFVLAAALAAVFLWDLRTRLFARWDRQSWLAIALYTLLALAAVAQAWPSADVVLAESPPGPGTAPFLFTEALVSRADPFLLSRPSDRSELFAFVLSLLAFLPIRGLCAKAGLSLALVAGAAAFMVLSCLAVSDALHAGLLFLYVMCLLWMAWPRLGALKPLERTALWAALGLIVVSQDAPTVLAWRYELQHPYSAAPEAGRALQAELRAHPSARVAAMGTRTIALQPWLSRNAFANHAAGAMRPAYYLWSTAETVAHTPSPTAWRALAHRGYDVLVLGEMQNEGPTGLAPYVAGASAEGYGLTEVFRGQPQWRGYAIAPDDIFVFRPSDAARKPTGQAHATIAGRVRGAV